MSNDSFLSISKQENINKFYSDLYNICPKMICLKNNVINSDNSLHIQSSYVNKSIENNKNYPLAFIDDIKDSLLLDKNLRYIPQKGLSISNIEIPVSDNLLNIYKSSNNVNTIVSQFNSDGNNVNNETYTGIKLLRGSVYGGEISGFRDISNNYGGIEIKSINNGDEKKILRLDKNGINISGNITCSDNILIGGVNILDSILTNPNFNSIFGLKYIQKYVTTNYINNLNINAVNSNNIKINENTNINNESEIPYIVDDYQIYKKLGSNSSLKYNSLTKHLISENINIENKLSVQSNTYIGGILNASSVHVNNDLHVIGNIIAHEYIYQTTFETEEIKKYESISISGGADILGNLNASNITISNKLDIKGKVEAKDINGQNLTLSGKLLVNEINASSINYNKLQTDKLKLLNSTTTKKGEIGIIDDSLYIDFNENNTFNIDSIGNIGIGLGNPNFNLDIKQDIHSYGNFFNSSRDYQVMDNLNASNINKLDLLSKKLELLDLIKSIDIYELEYKDYYSYPTKKNASGNNANYYGLLANNIEIKLPNAVIKKPSLNPNRMDVFYKNPKLNQCKFEQNDVPNNNELSSIKIDTASCTNLEIDKTYIVYVFISDDLYEKLFIKPINNTSFIIKKQNYVKIVILGEVNEMSYVDKNLINTISFGGIKYLIDEFDKLINSDNTLNTDNFVTFEKSVSINDNLTVKKYIHAQDIDIAGRFSINYNFGPEDYLLGSDGQKGLKWIKPIDVNSIDHLIVTNDVQIGGTTILNGNVNIKNKLSINGESYFEKSLYIKEGFNIRAGGFLSVNEHVYINDNLNVNKDTFINGNLNVSNITIGNDIYIGDKLKVKNENGEYSYGNNNDILLINGSGNISWSKIPEVDLKNLEGKYDDLENKYNNLIQLLRDKKILD